MQRCARRWEERLARAARFVFEFMQIGTGNINYPISGAAALAIADQVLGEPRYGRRARELAHASLAYISRDNKLLFGEGKPQDGLTAGGCRAVDLGYNVEESLPNLALYAKLTNDPEVLGPLVETMRAHLEFLLPDGAWDNSWGTRNFKWSYWGTRTGDGCQGAYALLADQDPRFAAAAFRNAQLLDRFTRDGILAGGLHYPQQGELPCIHHTFCHARSLATVLDNTAPLAPAAVALPRDAASGVREFSEIRTWLAGIGPWRATVTAYDWVYDAEALPAGHASGGALSMLWHSALGPVMLASVTEYGLVEPSNMQPPREGPPVPLTPRVELETGGVTYRSINDLTAQVRHRSGPDGIRFEIRGELKDRRQRDARRAGPVPPGVRARHRPHRDPRLAGPRPPREAGPPVHLLARRAGSPNRGGNGDREARRPPPRDVERAGDGNRPVHPHLPPRPGLPGTPARLGALRRPGGGVDHADRAAAQRLRSPLRRGATVPRSDP